MKSSVPSRINRSLIGKIINTLIVLVAALFLAERCGSAQERNNGLPAGKHSIKPFHIVGNIYYVGLDDNTSYLITSPQGHILLDMTYEAGVPYIRKNIEELGFKVKDIKYLLNAHAHADHIGGLAGFKELTGGTVYVSAPDAPVIADGGRNDFRNKDGKEEWRPVNADKILKDNEEIKLGGNAMVAHLTPGHTKGCTTWTTVAEENGKKYNVVFVCSVGLAGMGIASGVPLLNNPKYPAMADDFAKSFKLLKSLTVDVFLASHGSFFHMAEKIKRMEAGGGTEVWIDPQGYKTYVADEEKAYLAEIEKGKRNLPSAGGQ